MKDKIIEAVLNLLDDYRSRKFIIAISYGAVVIANRVYGWNIEFKELILIGCGALAFIIPEAIADVVERIRK